MNLQGLGLTGILGDTLGLTDFVRNNAMGGKLGLFPQALGGFDSLWGGKPKATPGYLNNGLDPLGFLRGLGYISQ